jgi:hypothetical protein
VVVELVSLGNRETVKDTAPNRHARLLGGPRPPLVRGTAITQSGSITQRNFCQVFFAVGAGSHG